MKVARGFGDDKDCPGDCISRLVPATSILARFARINY